MADFKPVDPKTVTPAEHQQHINNHLASYDAATPGERQAGKRFYSRAHRAAVTVAKGEEPGVIPHGEASTPAMKRGVYRPPGVTQEHVSRAAAQIAVLSPGSPAGMDWENNAQAAYEVNHMSDKDAAGMHRAVGVLRESQRQAGALKEMKGTKNPGTPTQIKSQQRVALTAHEKFKAVSVSARAPLKGTSMNKAGMGPLTVAHDLHTGKVSPEEAVPAATKTGAFHANISDPAHSQRATVDFRSHDIGVGMHLPTTNLDRGLGSVKRYAYHEGTIQEAAAQRGVHPHQLQAVEWLADKRYQMRNQSAKDQALGRGGHRSGGKPVGQ